MLINLHRESGLPTILYSRVVPSRSLYYINTDSLHSLLGSLKNELYIYLLAETYLLKI